jgi:hypothetical protein
MNILNKQIRTTIFRIFTAKYVFSQSFQKNIYNHSITNEIYTAALGYFYPNLNRRRHMQFWLR